MKMSTVYRILQGLNVIAFAFLIYLLWGMQVLSVGSLIAVADTNNGRIPDWQIYESTDYYTVVVHGVKDADLVWDGAECVSPAVFVGDHIPDDGKLVKLICCYPNSKSSVKCRGWEGGRIEIQHPDYAGKCAVTNPMGAKILVVRFGFLPL